MKCSWILALALAAAVPALADEKRSSGTTGFDWNRCAEKDRIAAQCEIERSAVFNSFVRRGSPEGYCDELALRQATRDCSAFGPQGERQ